MSDSEEDQLSSEYSSAVVSEDEHEQLEPPVLLGVNDPGAVKSLKKKRSRRKRDPSKPTGPMSAYLFFSQALRAKLKEQDPKLSMAEMTRRIGEKWRVLDEDGRRPFQELAEKDRLRYKREMLSYSPPEDEFGHKRKRKKDPNEPKKPMSAYLCYSQKRRPEMKLAEPHLRLGELAKRIGDEWAKMSNEEKQPYIERSDGLKRAYAQNMAAFRAARNA
eukprot:m.79620 g.79620  ORF g.79620 m.79620 type:complete len:218 (+) comp14802_c0_seq2:2085-2738(+)